MYRRLSHLFLLAALVIGIGLAGAQPAAAAPAVVSRTPVFIDTDTGVDDAVALALLLRAPTANVVGISTVVGNTSVDNASRNVLTVLDIAGRTVPVTVGADKPLVFPASRVGAFVHGPDGLWFAQKPHDLAALPHDAPAAIAAAARANPGMTLLALGPLTNIAQAVQRFPQDLAQVNIVALVGAKKGGNRSPVAEANAFGDPQALDIVVKGHLKLTLITLDAFSEMQLDSATVTKGLSNSRDPLFQFLAAPINAYAAAQTQGTGGKITIPDAVAAAYVLYPQIATPLGAIVAVQTDAGQTRGQTIIATDPNEKVFMIADDAELSALADAVFSGQIADINAEIAKILARHPDDAQVVLSLNLRGHGRNPLEALLKGER
jgi:inosine-uridine nucleoside N-ribohydrolase